MTLRMANPWKHPSGTYYFRERPPSDVARKVRGKRFSITIAGETTSVVVGEHVRVSLRTKEDCVARDRHREVALQVARLHAAHRDSTEVELSHRQVLQLAGEYYRGLVSEYADNPGDAEGWEASFDAMCEALELFVPDEDDEAQGRRKKRFDPDLGERLLSERLGVSEFLFSRGLHLSPRSRRAFLGAAGRAHLEACSRLRRHAEGNYAPDPAEARYPADAIRPAPPSAEGGIVDLWALFKAWAAERAPVSDTVTAYRSILTEFTGFIGHANAARFTPHDVVAWKNKLIADGVPAKSINDYKLAALKAVLNHAVRNHRLPANPAAKISVDQKRKPGTRMQGYSDEEARLILDAATNERRPAIRWVPWLCALTGARVAEMCQLRAEDVRREGDVWTLHITAAAGRLKNEASEREVPLHPALVARGFLDFVQSRGTGYLFFDPLRRREGAKARPGKSIANDLREWVKGLGIEV
ncbi:MAG: Site-specific recombinase XerD, partial [Hyphomicrobiales bacterium]|nr:Site-specific recombinase XerD [Hyphomicrobiales bacterium]